MVPGLRQRRGAGRKQTRAAVQADPVGQYIAALDRGETGPLETGWPDHVTVYDPRRRGKRPPRPPPLRQGKPEPPRRPPRPHRDRGLHRRRGPGRRRAHGPCHRRRPRAALARRHRGRLRRRPVDHLPHLPQPVGARRPAPPPPAHPAPRPGTGPARRHRRPLPGRTRRGDTEAIVATFAPDGYLQEPLGPPHSHRGQAELRDFFARCFRDGGIGLELAASPTTASAAPSVQPRSWGRGENARGRPGGPQRARTPVRCARATTRSRP